MNLNPYLNFNGRCEEAFRFYEKCLGGKIEMMLSAGDSPMAAQTPPERRKMIVHARLKVGGFTLMGSDVRPEMYEPAKGHAVNLTLDDAVSVDRVFNALAEGGTIGMPLQETFFAPRFGTVVDRFGIQWLVGCEPKS